ncbi:LPS assembly protein LptD [Persephonella sp. IF05-L8]|uniref:LPS assembly protein LptD n=1 Tax=Persephonella sp. IF05-L8 TaxID=1158338 RepID=UPI0004973AC2
MRKIIISIFLLCSLVVYSFGKTPVSIEAENIYRENDGKIIAVGDVVVKYKNETLKADKIIYDQLQKKIYLYGHIRVKTPKYDLTGTEGWIDEKGYYGEFKNVKGVINGYYYIKAKRVKKVKDKYYFYDGEFSSCSFDNYDWYFKAKKGVLIENKDIIFYNISLRFCKIPLFFSPYFSYPATSRRSGFLFPQIGSDSYNDLKVVQPFFLILTRHSDMTFTFDYRNQQGKGLDIQYRNKFSAEEFYTGNFVVFNENSSNGQWWQGREGKKRRNRWRLYGNLYKQWNDFDIYFKYDIPSDPYFFEDIYNATNLRYKAYTKSQLIALMDKRNYTVEINFDFLYDLSRVSNEETLQRLPELRFYWKKRKLFNKIPLYFDFLSVNTNFYREKGTSGIRSDNTLNLQIYNNFRSISSTFTFSPRATWYLLSDEVNNNRTPTRNIFKIEDRVRALIFKNYGKFIHSIIPEIKVYHVSKVNQEKLPYFDREDRVKDAKDIDLALYNILNFKNRKDFLSWEISTGYTLNNYYYLGNTQLTGHRKPLKNKLYLNINKFSVENTLYYDFYFNQIVRTISSLSIPITSWLKYSVSHSFDKGLFEGVQSTNQVNQTLSLTWRDILISGSILNNIKEGYVQRKNFTFMLNRKCWRLKINYKEDFNKVTGKTFSSIYVYINILRTDIKLPFVSRQL